MARGRQLATHGDAALEVPACMACHGQRLTGVAPAIPGLAGLPRDYINAQLGAWRNKVRRANAPDCMASIAARLSLADVAAVSGWLAAQPVPQDASPAAAVARPLPLACGSSPD
jgi:cytochrome c553